jgi:hypothetical protein
MSAREVPLHQDGSHPPYVVWDTNMLPPSNVVEEGVFPPDVSVTTGDMTIGLTINTGATSVQSILQHVRRNINISIAQPGV